MRREIKLNSRAGDDGGGESAVVSHICSSRLLRSFSGFAACLLVTV